MTTNAATNLHRFVPAVIAASTAWVAHPSSFSSGSSSTCESTNRGGKRRILSQPSAGARTGKAKLLFLGSGSSTGCPKPLCALAFPEHKNGDPGQRKLDPSLPALQKQVQNSCRTSRLAALGDPRFNKDYRNNPSLLISHRNDDDNQYNDGSLPPVRNVVIDVGKTFRETAIRWMPPNDIYSLDAIVLTHEHMDAVAGLDDVRGFQRGPLKWDGGGPPPRLPTHVFLSRQCLEAIKKQFFYLVPPDPTKSHGGSIVQGSEEGKIVVRAVSALQYNIIQPFEPFVAAGLRMVLLPVMHGEDLVCFGFAFTVKGVATTDESGSGHDAKDLNVVYLSDISRMLEATEAYIQNLLPTDILVIDSLLAEREHPVHYSLKQAIELARRLKPKKTFIVGMNCDDFRPHDEMNRELKALDDIDVQLAHDGLVIEV